MNSNFSSLQIFKRSGLLALFFLLITSLHTFATHLRAGEIRVVSNGCGLTFTITVIAYTNTKSTTVKFGGDGTAILDFGDGQTFQVPSVDNTVRLDLDPSGNIATAQYSVSHTYSGYGRYTISYKEPNRNEGVLNMSNSVETEFYVETTINIDPFYGCNNPPQLAVPPIDRGCKGVSWFHNPGAFDPDGKDSLAYELVIPFQDRNLTVNDYKDPADRKFYNNFGKANEAGTGPPSFIINARDGTITWDSPGAIGEYNIAFIVKEFRKIKGVWRELSRVRRDMQIIIDDCKNKRPDLKVPKDTCVEAGTILKAKIIGFDTDVPPNNVKIEAFSDIFSLAPAQSPATISSLPNSVNYDPKFKPSPDTLYFKWSTQCAHVRVQPYQVVFKITDNSPTGSSLVTFKTWFIHVVGPPPGWDKAALNLPKRTVNLVWKDYTCKNAETMQVWRRVDKVDFKPDNCETGMPEFLGYKLIGLVPLKDSNNNPVTKFTDTNNGKGLAPGARYCYRLVASYPEGAESYVSLDTCLDPILATAPVITNVTVEKTDVSTGEIRVSWRRPFDANKIAFPPPYQYKVFRGLGFNGVRGSLPVYTGTDTTFVDKSLNTQENPYNYQITCYDKNGFAMDTSSVASAVRLETSSLINKIELSWGAEVPWSNQTEKFPRHLIYRAGEGEALQLIDSVDVTVKGFTYEDAGQFNNTPLKDGKTYCYKVETRGTYGNPKIQEPLKNLSQIICAQTGDSIPPCKPLPPLRSTLDFVNCEDYFEKFGCGNSNFRNIIIWNKPEDAACRDDIFGYLIYYASSSIGTYIILTDTLVRDTVYIDKRKGSLARCYKIAAVDRSGNVGPLSDPVCFDNCPFYELPNVFTPNGDGCNSKFSAYGDQNGETGNDCVTPPENKKKCPRFVQSVLFRVYNRWGKEVYNYSGGDAVSDSKNSIYINWDGRGSNGIELASGVYYYIAEVTFDVVDPSQTVKIIRGWVHLIR